MFAWRARCAWHGNTRHRTSRLTGSCHTHCTHGELTLTGSYPASNMPQSRKQILCKAGDSSWPKPPPLPRSPKSRRHQVCKPSTENQQESAFISTALCCNVVPHLQMTHRQRHPNRTDTSRTCHGSGNKDLSGQTTLRIPSPCSLRSPSKAAVRLSRIKSGGASWASLFLIACTVSPSASPCGRDPDSALTQNKAPVSATPKAQHVTG
jgi:hypothetical protein